MVILQPKHNKTDWIFCTNLLDLQSTSNFMLDLVPQSFLGNFCLNKLYPNFTLRYSLSQTALTGIQFVVTMVFCVWFIQQHDAKIFSIINSWSDRISPRFWHSYRYLSIWICRRFPCLIPGNQHSWFYFQTIFMIDIAWYSADKCPSILATWYQVLYLYDSTSHLKISETHYCSIIFWRQISFL